MMRFFKCSFVLILILSSILFVSNETGAQMGKATLPDKVTVHRNKPFYDNIAMPIDVPGETTWYSPIQHEPKEGPWIIQRCNFNSTVPWSDAGLLYGSHGGSTGRWEKQVVGTRVTQKNGVPPYREYEWIVIQGEHRTTQWQTVDAYEYEKERNREPDLTKLDPTKFLPILQRYMAEAIAYAESESMAVNPRRPIYQQAGFKDAKSFARLKDERYYICERILKEACKE